MKLEAPAATLLLPFLWRLTTLRQSCSNRLRRFIGAMLN
jgi:hypothetical protein